MDKHLDRDVKDGPAEADDFFKDFDELVPADEYAFVRPGKAVEVDHEADEADDKNFNTSIKSILNPGAAPTIDPPAEGEVILPGGLVDEDGTVFKSAQVRELNGEDEEALARAQGDVRRIRVLMGAVESIGGKPVTKDKALNLLIGDREALILGIRIATFGKDIVFENYVCPGCGESLDVTVDLSTLDMKTLENPEKREFEVALRKGVALVRLPTGADQEAVLGAPNATSAEENTVMLSRCVISIDGKKIGNSKDAVKKLGVKDRQTLLAFLAETQPGPRYDEVKSKHETCDTEFPVYLAVDDMFRGV